MSSYTEVILVCCGQDGYFKIDELNAILDANEIPRMQKALPDVASIFVASVNYLPFDYLLDAINSIQWESPNQVQLFLRGENDDKFSEVELHPNSMPPHCTMREVDDKGNVLSERTERYPSAAPSAVKVVEDITGSTSPLLVHLITASREYSTNIGEPMVRLDRFVRFLRKGEMAQCAEFAKSLLDDETRVKVGLLPLLSGQREGIIKLVERLEMIDRKESEGGKRL